MMTRYERVSTDCAPMNNGKKAGNFENGRSISSTTASTTTSSFETNKGFIFKSSSSRHQDHHHHNHHHHNHHRSGSSSSPPSHSDQRNDASPSGGGTINKDVFLQWGQKKRARVSRSEIRALADESSSSVQAKQPINKLPRRADSKLSTPAMPPPPPPPPPQQHSSNNNISNNSKGGNFRSFAHYRVLEKRSGAGNLSPSRTSGGGGGSSSRVVSRSITSGAKRSPEKIEKKVSNSRQVKPNGSMAMSHTDLTPSESEQDAGFNTATPPTCSIQEKLNPDVVMEWPRIIIALSRKEKEDDFFAMKGTKLPQRPKKRAKNVDKTLQYCFPGMWLSDLTKGRYEVREKKCAKKQPKIKGLKGMESLDTDSE